MLENVPLVPRFYVVVNSVGNGFLLFWSKGNGFL